MTKYEYIISDNYDMQKQIQCLAVSFDAAWDIARAAAMRYGGFVVEIWEAGVK